MGENTPICRIEDSRELHDTRAAPEAMTRVIPGEPEITGDAFFDWEAHFGSGEQLAAGGVAFSTQGYASEESAARALDRFMDEVLNEALRDAAP